MSCGLLDQSYRQNLNRSLSRLIWNNLLLSSMLLIAACGNSDCRWEPKVCVEALEIPGLVGFPSERLFIQFRVYAKLSTAAHAEFEKASCSRRASPLRNVTSVRCSDSPRRARSSDRTTMDSQFHTAGSPVWIWVTNEQGWEKGTVQKIEQDGKLQVRLDSGKTASYKPDDCPLRNVESRMGVEVKPCRKCRVQIYSYTMQFGQLLLKYHFENGEVGPHICCPAGHDGPLLPERAWRSVEFELQIHPGRHIHIHRLHSDCRQSLCLTAPHVWLAHDGAVQGSGPWRAFPACVCHLGLCIQTDAERWEKSIHPGGFPRQHLQMAAPIMQHSLSEHDDHCAKCCQRFVQGT